MTKFDVVQLWGNDVVGWEFVEAEGASGGLLLMWDATVFKLSNCYKGARWLCVDGMLLKNNFRCAFCIVYGEHVREDKLVVWEELSFLAGLCQVPFCFMGDFNEIVQVEEMQGAISLPRSATEFKAWIHDMELVDLSLTDCRFTWFRGQSCSRIDRVLVSLEWLEEFPETRLRGGPRGLSDHCPLIINVTRWHREHFGDVDMRINKFEEEIRKVDDLVSNGVCDGTSEARKKALVSFCKKWYIRKEVHWKQMSRSKHAKEMDKNTRYFHNLALAHRRNNRIDALRIHGRLEPSPNIGFWEGLVRQITEEEATELELMPSAEEIKAAVWDCESAKAPGSDGYNMNFIKKCWEEVGRKFMEAVMGFF
ncbi:uncharacterized protein LOC107607311 [Arachis ipaensis]|uniref:uncharacterized protein LOC107607311 n=1 Tax=Arachis ipaensis TaxID=130454 RepID=UPI0007AFC24B|nr:uncharacterized protein LOC107607311 [Arachis ipaensis]XP_025664812.1 uncharacterized protein LOC112763327 [Arachis hypogaea]